MYSVFCIHEYSANASYDVFIVAMSFIILSVRVMDGGDREGLCNILIYGTLMSSWTGRN